MYKNVLVFYSRLPISGIEGKTRIGKEIDNQKLASKLARALINDMLAEYNPFLEDEYDLVYYYDGDLDNFRSRYKYNVRRYLQGLSSDVKVGMTHAHGIMARHYENIIIVGSDIPGITKQTIKHAFKKLETENDAVIVPVVDGGYGLFGTRGAFTRYGDIENYDSSTQGYNLAQETIQLLEGEGASVYTFPEKIDIDTVADVQTLYAGITAHDNLRPEYMYLQKTFELLKKHKKEFKL